MMRVALIGLGNAGYTLHLPALAQLGSATVVGACDPDATRRDRAHADFGMPVFPTFRALISAVNADVVVVGTPPDRHREDCLEALAHGAHVICEKPFASSLQEADDVLAAAESAGRHVALNHQFREMPIFRALLEETQKSEVGDVAFAQVWQLVDLAPWAESGWRGRLLHRTLYEAGAHLVDFLIALFGEVPTTVQATTSNCGVHQTGADAVSLVTLEFSRGRLAQIVQNRLCKGETQYFEVRAETRGASLRASFGGRARVSAGVFRGTRPHARVEFGVSGLAWREIGSRRTLLARNPRNPMEKATRLVFEKTFRAFEDGSTPPTSGQLGRTVLEVIAACYHSASVGHRVDLRSPETAALSTFRMGASPAAVAAGSPA